MYACHIQTSTKLVYKTRTNNVSLRPNDMTVLDPVK